MALTRVRGRIDILTTEARLLLSRGEVFCRFHDLTMDTPRNRLVRAALDLMARLVKAPDWYADAGLWPLALLGQVLAAYGHRALTWH